MSEFTAELVGTFLLILLGGGVCANVNLKKTCGHDSGWIVITAGWGLAVAMAIYAVVNFSGAHINPAVTLGLASIGELPWSDVPKYVTAQFLGAILGATTVWLAYLPHWEVTEDPATKLGVFSNAPAIRKPFANLLCEIIGTFALVLGVLAILSPDALTPVQQDKLGGEKAAELARQGWENSLKPLLVGLLVFSIGLSLGGPTGYAINPARDLGPRIAHALLPIHGKGNSDWGYAWIPVIGPCIGGVLGALTYKALWQ
ncbi:aquaporin family protein [Verrucomicrobia bacterium]|nr:aquaporin family protein [Verrucomicrobiota bacterium]MDC0218788.1 aquaporin family protein [Verrucomicrobiota bacterium]